MKAIKKCLDKLTEYVTPLKIKISFIFKSIKEFDTKEFLNQIPSRVILPFFIIGGLIAGLGAYTIYASEVFSYLSDDPVACINCHVMTPSYQSWSRSSHTNWTNCNDCHVPQNNILSKYYFKAKDGLYHSTVFTVGAESQTIRPRESSKDVIMENCIRCHLQLNTEFVKTGMITYSETKKGKGKPCWDCHTKVPHTRISSLTSSPDAIVPSSQSPVPDWLKNIMGKK
jgi:cytochrome c nitrite reductase small subunit